MELTREKVLSMGTEELSLAVAETIFSAKIIGRENDPDAKLLIGEFESGVWKPLIGRWQTANWRNSEEKAWLNCPRYAEDISAAWEVVEQITGDKWMLHSFSQRLDENSNIDGYECCFFERWEGVSRTATADSVPLAICRTALLTTIKE